MTLSIYHISGSLIFFFYAFSIILFLYTTDARLASYQLYFYYNNNCIFNCEPNAEIKFRRFVLTNVKIIVNSDSCRFWFVSDTIKTVKMISDLKKTSFQMPTKILTILVIGLSNFFHVFVYINNDHLHCHVLFIGNNRIIWIQTTI